jgi:hypothetical protein
MLLGNGSNYEHAFNVFLISFMTNDVVLWHRGKKSYNYTFVVTLDIVKFKSRQKARKS